MRYIELPEKLIILLETILEYKILVFMVAFLIVFTFLVINKRITKKKYVALVSVTFLISLIITAFTTDSSVTETFNNVINNIFTAIYFPSVEVYIAILIIMFIAVINAFVNKKMQSAYKINNIIMFFTLVFLFISFLLTISDNRIDVFDTTSIYTNVNCLVLLQLSTSVFILWLIISIIIYTVNAIMNKINPKEEVAKVVKPVINQNSLPNKEIVIECDEEIITDFPKDEDDDLIIESPVIMKQEEKFTLNDYKIFNRMLKNTLMLNSYKGRITVADMLNPATLGNYTEEEYRIYKKILHTYID